MDLHTRRAAVEAARGELTGGRSVLVVGEQGSGRTGVLERLRDALADQGRSVVVVRGADAVADVPLAAFAEVITTHGVAGAAPLAVYTALPVEVAARGTTVLVDDAGQLDTASAVLLGQLARAGAAVAVVVARPEDLPTSVLDESVHRGWARVDLDPLPPDDVLRLAAGLVGDELSAASAAALVTLAEGHVRCAVELVTAAGAVDRGPAGIFLGEVVATPAVRRRAAAATAGLGADALDALADVAVAPDLPVDLFAPGVLVDLEAAGLVRIDGSCVRQTRPMVALALQSDAPPSVRRARQARISAALRGRPGWTGTSALLAVRAGGEVEDEQLLAAADAARAASRTAEARELLDALDGTSETERVLRAAVAAADGDLDDAVGALRSVDLDAVDDDLRVRIGQEWGLALAVRGADPRAAVVEVAAVLDRVESREGRRVLETDLVKWRLMAGENPSGEPVAPASEDARTRLNEALIGAMLASLGGPVAEVTAHVEAGRSALVLVEEAPRSTADLLSLSEYLGTAFDGRVPEAERLATRCRDRAALEGDPSLGMWEFAAAELALHRGDLLQADALARRAVRHLAWRDFTGLQPAAVALAAAVDARSGRLGSAEDRLDGVTELHRADVKVELHVARTRAERALRSRDRQAAADLLAAAGRTAVEQSHLYFAALALDEAFMVDPGPARLDDVQTSADLSPLTAALARRAEAVVSGSTAVLAGCVDELEQMGLLGRAAHATQVLARLHGRAGHTAAAREWKTRGVLLGSRQVSAWPVQHDAESLTPRELDIARRAARRERSREIGADLGLSVRTVDNHLARIYRKLGISGRDDLTREVLDSLSE
ncbi:transcriptional regulator, LuxR family [Aeromicrobium marinum DSM 15272]|uniref:Transcriptional regulator, LuxR family n=1 Tax=Aeromicrobium marinum DSM 15272 TaxID=585531 RepID=E2SFW2_9ACTN|nr:helix-turn-helix transcriptional regulator [Aeromicrobium marinum]EFQ81909.1 transcriptional regulator, LuxR family [Aeromicrobium marinum DSM 15272]